MTRTFITFGSALICLGAAFSVRNFQPDNAQQLANPNFGPIPGEDPIYSLYRGTDPPFPGNVLDAILPTAQGPPATDDVVFQNLLAAEWVIFSFYQQGVEALNTSSFVELGYSNLTYDAIQEIRDNEAGHLRIFQGKISPTSVKPGSCRYDFPFDDAETFLALQTIIEISSMVFLTGLIQAAQLPSSHAAMTAIGQVETRHEIWALLDVWKANPFGGPIDTIFPYANQILDTTNNYIIPGSCPRENPEYPSPRQNLPLLSVAKNTTSLEPGATIEFVFPNPNNQPTFQSSTEYFATFFHGPGNVSVPIETKHWPHQAIRAQIPSDFEPKGVFIAVISDVAGASTAESVIAGPTFLLLQPAELGIAIAQG